MIANIIGWVMLLSIEVYILHNEKKKLLKLVGRMYVEMLRIDLKNRNKRLLN